jgi:hypothetical protein
VATKTLGTGATNSLTAIMAAEASEAAQSGFASGNFGNISAVDFATMKNAILNDRVNSTPIWPDALVREGFLYVPNRGRLMILPGDWVGVDASGWPILVSEAAIEFGSTSWSHS